MSDAPTENTPVTQDDENTGKIEVSSRWAYARERFGPIVISAVASTIVFMCCGRSDITSALEAIDETMISIVSIAVGFTAASVGILLTGQTAVLDILRTSKSGFRTLIGFHTSAIKWGIVYCMVNVWTIATTSWHGVTLPFVAEIWMLSGAMSLYLFVRIVWYFNSILEL